MRGALAALSLLVVVPATGALRAAVVREWTLVDNVLEARTTASLLRYYSVIRHDSIQVRYISRNAGRTPYRLRALMGDNDSLGQLLLVSIGQLRLFPTDDIRIALGDDLYADLIRSRTSPGSGSRLVDLGDNFGHDDWIGDHRMTLSLDRVDVRVLPEMNVFAQLGAPESNLWFWNDGTWRGGLATPDWEVAAVLPLDAGDTALGFLHQRLLAPGYGAAGVARYGGLTARARVTGIQSAAAEAYRTTRPLFVHTLSSGLTYRHDLRTAFGTLDVAGGLGYETFAALRDTGKGELAQIGNVRRLSPIVELRFTTIDENLRASLGTVDQSLCLEGTVRLNRNIWFELRMVKTDLFRERKPFEHAFSMFLTPRIKF